MTTPNLKDAAPYWLATKFYRYTTAMSYDTFTSDEFREANLHIYLENPSKQVGSFFAGLKQREYIVEMGRARSHVPANNQRRVSKYMWTPFGITELAQR